MKVSLASRIKNINYSLEYAKAIMAKLIWNINASPTSLTRKHGYFINIFVLVSSIYIYIYIRIVSDTIKNKINLISDTARIGGDI
jgi:hypothetical protein